MPVRITGRHVEITDEIRSFIEKKLPRIEKYTERIQKLEVIIDKDRYLFCSEMRMKSGPIDFTASAKDSDLFRSIDLLIDKAERLLQKEWAKLRGNKKHGQESTRHPSAKAEAEEEPVATAVLAPPKTKRKAGSRATRALPLLAENVGVHIFPQTQVNTPVMSIEEAAEELFFTDENFLCFVSEESGQLGIMFRRKDGHFGVVEPSMPSRGKSK